MDWSQALFQVIDLRSFSSVWYWLVVAVTWSSVSHWVLGVPYDLIQKARRVGGQAERDLVDIVRVNVNRLLGISETVGTLLTLFLCFILTSLFALGFFYDVELCQAIFLLAFPLSIVGVISWGSAQKIKVANPSSDELYRYLSRHRFQTQVIGMLAVFVTAMWGMYQNLDIIRFL